MRDYHSNDEDREGPRRLKEGRGKPQGRGRGGKNTTMMKEVQLLRQSDS